MEKRFNRQELLQSYVSSQWPDLPARFESLNDDTLTTILQFVGKKSYRSFGVNKRCKEVYLNTPGMTKETFLFGYAPLSRITDRVERSDMENDLGLQLSVGAGVVCYNRKDVMDWALEERKKYVLKGICILAVEKGRFDLLEEIFNVVGDWDEKEDIFEGLDFSAASFGRLSVLEWLETHQLDFDEGECAMAAAFGGRIHILEWLREKRGLELFGDLYVYAIQGGRLHVMKWLREQACPWNEYTFQYAAENTGNLAILQWLHDEGCPWPEYLSVPEEEVKPDVLDWLHVNGYGDRIFV